MTTPLTEQDLIQLNAYLDGELTAAARADVESRLAEDKDLQAELESLRVTAALLGMAERVRVPRSFTLDPAVYGRPVRSGWWASLGAGGFPTWATAGITTLVVLVCIGLMISRIGIGGMGTPSPAMEQFAAEAPEAEPTEAPAEEFPAEATEAPVPASGWTQMEEATAPPPAPTQAAPSEVGGIGGGPSEGDLTAAAEVPPGERSSTANGADTLAAPPAAEKEQATSSASPPSLQDVTPLQAYTAAAATPTPAPAWIDGQALGLPVKSILLLGGAIILIAGAALVGVILRRRSQ